LLIRPVATPRRRCWGRTPATPFTDLAVPRWGRHGTRRIQRWGEGGPRPRAVTPPDRLRSRWLYGPGVRDPTGPRTRRPRRPEPPRDREIGRERERTLELTAGGGGNGGGNDKPGKPPERWSSGSNPSQPGKRRRDRHETQHPRPRAAATIFTCRMLSMIL
jgi:hypothetical protein